MGKNNKKLTLSHKLQINISPDQYDKLIILRTEKKGNTIGKIIRKLIDALK